MKKIALFFFIILLASTGSRSVVAQQVTSSPNVRLASSSEYIPNDPKLDVAQARAINLLKAYAKILEIEQTSQPKMERAVMAFLDDWIDCTHPDLQPNCMAELAFNATDRPYQNSEMHGTHAAGTGAAGTDNNIGVSSVAFGGRLKFIPIKVCDGGFCKSAWIQTGLAKVLEYKRAGIPIVVAGCNFSGGGTDPAGMDKLLKDLDAEQIDLIAPSPDGVPAINMDDFEAFPVSYARRYKNIIAVTAGDETGERLALASYYGPNTFTLVAPGVGIKTVSTLNPLNDSASMSGSSSMTQRVTTALALIRVYREADSAKAREILRFTARMFSGLDGKLKSSPGNNNDAGRMAGRVDIYDALTMVFGCPAPTSAIMWVTKRDDNRAIALESISATPGPFSLTTPRSSLHPDGQTRLMVFAYNINVTAGPNPPGILVAARDSTNQTALLPVEYISQLPEPLSCVTQLNLNLRTQPQLATGDITLTIMITGQKSGEAVITIKP